VELSKAGESGNAGGSGGGGGFSQTATPVQEEQEILRQ
jgi:hypothetical protein